MNELWEQFKKYYMNLHKVSERIVDLIAVIDIIRLCAKGLSNKSISKFLDMDEEYIRSVLIEFIDFEGFDKNLDMDILDVFQRSSSIEEFSQRISEITPLISEGDKQKGYEVCMKYFQLKKELDEGVK